jgi:hypothetical protein
MVRRATPADLDAIVALTTASRHRLAEWSPSWWRPSAHADELHPLWLGHLIQADGPVVRVATDSDDAVVGCAVSMPQAAQTFVDDVAVVDDDRWGDVGLELLESITERPALTCVPTAHLARRATSLAAGLHHASSYWIRGTTTGGTRPVPVVPQDAAVPPPAAHTFGGPFDPWADGGLAFLVDDGLVVGSVSMPAPPVYDPGGTVTVVDRVTGHALPLLERALAGAGARGDVLLAVVAAVDDRPLRSALHELDFERTVDVFTWPARRTAGGAGSARHDDRD